MCATNQGSQSNTINRTNGLIEMRTGRDIWLSVSRVCPPARNADDQGPYCRGHGYNESHTTVHTSNRSKRVSTVLQQRSLAGPLYHHIAVAVAAVPKMPALCQKRL